MAHFLATNTSMLPEKLIDFVKDITGELKGLPCGLVV